MRRIRLFVVILIIIFSGFIISGIYGVRFLELRIESDWKGDIDKFDIKKINPTKLGGREWYSNWNNGEDRKILSGDLDPYDSQFRARGDGEIKIDGKGFAQLAGKAPRMYIYDQSLKELWKNVEMTVYAKRVGESETISWQSLTMVARSGSHNDVEYPDVCKDSIGYPNGAYNARITFNGRSDYTKEVLYHRADAVSDDGSGNSPRTIASFANLTTPIDSKSGLHSMPRNVWVGMKFIVKNLNNDHAVKLETWMDMTDGKDGGKWIKINEYIDDGEWNATYYYDDKYKTDWPCVTVPTDNVITNAMPYVLIRGDSVQEIYYKKFSVREIDPL